MRILLMCLSLFTVSLISFAQKNFNDTAFLQPVEITSVKAAEKNPFAKTNLTKEEIKQRNTGQDLPFILALLPSVTVNSDAGNGIGYTGIRIRGTDATRINVTLNGIPYNDAESLGTYFVDLPDIASSAGSIQVQRGVGTSANGAGSFGGSINVSTNEINALQNTELNTTAGSYGTLKNTIIYNSGIFKKHFTVDTRLSNIRSNGYIDRASSRLRSYYFSTAYLSEKNMIRFNVFSGKEKTYQAYYGVNEAALDTNRTYNSAGTDKPGAPYENEVDNYIQTHYQLFYTRKICSYLKGNAAVFFTKGKGYYEQYKTNRKLADYGLPAYGGITKTDIIRRLWLNNDFYGTVFSLQYDKKNTQVIFGGGYNNYAGEHYGEIIWAKEQAAVPPNYRWYDNNARKNDLSFYTKWTQSLSVNIQTFVDLQVRNIYYRINGFRYNPSLISEKKYTFFNPKGGITYSKNNYKLYASYGHAEKEPNRDDFEATPNQQPRAEKLNDLETGYEYKKNKQNAGVNIYYMAYKDQLVLTGKINDVGAYTRSNIPQSYRAGVEFFGGAAVNKTISFEGNITFSKNKVKNFTEYIDDYDNGGQIKKTYNQTDISFSPELISALSVNIAPVKNLLFTLNGKYTGRQFLDNTSDKNRMLRDYFTQDVRAGYTINGTKIKEINVFILAGNIFSKKYEANGYTFSYLNGGAVTTENYYFPMAPATWLLGVNIKL